MATISHVIRWADNTAELQRNLREGVNQIEAMRKSAEGMAKALGGDALIRAAHNAAAAVQQLGGATKLTEAEKARLAVTIQKAIDKYRALGQDAPRALTDLLQATQRATTATDKMAAGMAAMGEIGRKAFENATASDKMIAGMSAAGRATDQLTQSTQNAATSTSFLESKAIALGSAIGSFLGNIAYQAVSKLASAFVSAAQDGARFSAISGSFERLSASIGETGDVMLKVTRSATKGLISDLDIMQSSNKAMLLGLPVTAREMGTLSKAAVTLGRAMGQDATKSLDDLITALGRSSPLILDNLGLTVKVGEANEAYAKTLNKTADELTDAERKMAFYVAAMAAAEKKTDELGEIQLTLTDQIGRVITATKNVITEWVAGANEAGFFSAAVGALANSMERAADDIDLVTEAQKRLKAAGMEPNDGLRSIIGPNITLPTSLENADVQREIDKMLAERQAELLKNMGNPLALTATLGSADIGIGTDPLNGMLNNSEKLIKQTDDLARKLEQQAAAAQRTSDALFGRDVIAKAHQYAAAIGDVNNVQSLSIEKQREVGKTVRDAIEAQRRLGMSVSETFVDLSNAISTGSSKMEIIGQMTPTGLVAWKAEASDAAAAAEAMALGLDRLRSKMSVVGEFDPFAGLRAPDPMTSGVVSLGDQMVRDLEAYERKNATVVQSLRRTLTTDLAPTIMQALTGGGNVAQSVGGLIGGSLTQSLVGGTVGKAITGGLTSMLGSTIGGAVGSIIPGLGTAIGSMIGPLLGKLGGAIKGMFGGPSATELEGRAAEKQFVETLRSGLTEVQRLESAMLVAQGNSKDWADSVIAIRDAYIATGRTADEALRDRQRLYEAEKHGAEAVKRVMDEINKAFIEQRQDAERLEAAIKKYGFSIEELGPKFRAQQLNDQAKELIEDWRVLVASGIDVVLVNHKMADSINAYLKAALTTGAEVPMAMRPILQMLADQGLLFDANGDKISDLGQAGIAFSETMTQGFDRVVLKLQQLIDTLQGTGHAIEDLPDSYTLRFRAEGLDAINAEIDRLRNEGGIFNQITNAGEIANLIAERDALQQQVTQTTQVAAAAPTIDTSAQSLWSQITGGLHAMAEGGYGTVTKPTLFLAGEAGPEEYAFSGAGRRFESGGSSETRATQVSLALNGDIVLSEGAPATQARNFLRELIDKLRHNDEGALTQIADLIEAV